MLKEGFQLGSSARSTFSLISGTFDQKMRRFVLYAPEDLQRRFEYLYVQ